MNSLKKTIVIILLIFPFYNCSSICKDVTVNRQVLIAVRDIIADIEKEPNVTCFKYTVVPYEGKIETGWFRTHKGEVQLKVICTVSGDNYKLNVLQKGLIFEYDDTQWAKTYKKKLQRKIDKLLE